MPPGIRTRTLPLAPLLTAFRAGALTAPSEPSGLCVAFLDSATDEQLASALLDASTRALPVVYHPETFTRRVRPIRHALNHLLRSTDPLPERLARCAVPGEVYFVAGLGPGFWSAVLAGAEPDRAPVWCPAVERGLLRLGLLREIATDVRSRFDAVARLRGDPRTGARSDRRRGRVLPRTGRANPGS